MISKDKIQAAFIGLLEKKVADIKEELNAVRESATAETKSSMGDKYETSREMMMQERNRLGAQLDVFADQLAALNSIDPEKEYDQVTYGCLVETDQIHFFISAAVGQLAIEGQSIFAISGEAPIAKAMNGKHRGDTFSFNNKSFTVKDIA